MKKIACLLAFLPAFASAQISRPSVAPSTGGGTSTLTAGTTATSGCTDGGFLYSLTSLLRCGANAINDGSTVTIGGGISGSVTALVVNNGTSTGATQCWQDNGVTGWCINDGGQLKWTANSSGVISGFGGQTLSLTSLGTFVALSGTYGRWTFGSTANKDQSFENGIGKALTESSATNVVLISVSSGAAVGGSFQYVIEADDGTDFQSRSGEIRYAIANKAGTETCGLSGASEAADGSAVAVSAGTLTYAITCDTSPANGVYLQINAVSSLAQTTLRVHGYLVRGWSNSNGGPATFTFTAQ